MTDGWEGSASGRPRDRLDELSLDELFTDIGRWYQELAGLSRLEPDEALLRIAAVQAEVSARRALALRSPNGYVNSAVRREIDPLLATLDSQAKLIGRADSIRRRRRP